MMKYKSYILRKNQNVILTKLISKEFKKIMLSFDKPEFENDLNLKGKAKNLHKYMKTINGKKILILPHELCYVVSYMTLLNACAEDKNAFSENICQNLINLETLYKYIYISDYSIVLKHSLLSYFYHVYLDTERDIPFHILEIFLSIIKNLLEQFGFYSKKKYLENEDSVESIEDFMIMSYNSYKPFIEWVEDYLMILIESFINIIKRNLNLIPDSDPARLYDDFLHNLINYTQIAQEKFKNDAIIMKLNRMIREIYSKNPTGHIAEQIKEKHQDIIDNRIKFSEGKISVSNPKKSNRRSSRVKTNNAGNTKIFKRIEFLIDKYFSSEKYEDR